MAYLIQRLLSMAVTLFLISIITFTVTNILPGDVAMMIMGTQSNPEALENLRQSLGLNDPWIFQYGRWIFGMLTGDWGNSLLFKMFVHPNEDLLMALKHAFLPSLALGLGLMAHLTRMTRATMTGILSQEFIRVARAKGLAEKTVVWQYGLANAVGPVMTVAGLQMGYLFGSIIVMESLFNYTGMGWLTYQALLNRDIPLIQATVFVIAAVVMLVNLLVDLLYPIFDPRIRLK